MSKPKFKIYKAYSPEWEEKASELLKNYFTVYPCGKCNYPVLKGYCCLSCRTTDPDERTVDMYTGEPLKFKRKQK